MVCLCAVLSYTTIRDTTVFGRDTAKAERDQEALTAHLYQQIGQLKVERDFLSRKSGL